MSTIEEICYQNNIKIKPPPDWLFKPQLIRMGISRSCNFRCLMCWSYSPFLKDSGEDEWKKVKIDKNLAMRTIKEASEIGFKDVLFSGLGEPFTHPDMMDFIRESAKRGMGVVIQTNLSLADPIKLAEALEDVKEKSVICVNVGASNPRTYKEIHLNVDKNDFYDILNKMKFLLKCHIGVRMVYVVIKPNYQEIEKVIKMNKRIDSFLHLELADFVPGKGVEDIILDRKDREELYKKLAYLDGKDKETNSNISDFLAQVKYRGIGMPKLKRCLIGYNFCATSEIGQVYYCFNGKTKKFFMGDLNQFSLKEIWFSRKYNIMRKKLEGGEFLRECQNYCTNSNCVGSSRGSNFKIRFYINPSLPLPPS